VRGQKAGDLGWPERGVEPTHRSAAARAGIEVGAKDVSEEPRPAFARRGVGVIFANVVAAVDRGEHELVARRRRWRIVRAALDGTGITTLATHGSTSMAIAGDNLYFEGDVIGRIPKNGGNESTVATGQMGEDFLKAAGGNLVWVNHAQRSLSDTSQMTVNTACIDGP